MSRPNHNCAVFRGPDTAAAARDSVDQDNAVTSATQRKVTPADVFVGTAARVADYPLPGVRNHLGWDKARIQVLVFAALLSANHSALARLKLERCCFAQSFCTRAPERHARTRFDRKADNGSAAIEFRAPWTEGWRIARDGNLLKRPGLARQMWQMLGSNHFPFHGSPCSRLGMVANVPYLNLLQKANICRLAHHMPVLLLETRNNGRILQEAARHQLEEETPATANAVPCTMWLAMCMG